MPDAWNTDTSMEVTRPFAMWAENNTVYILVKNNRHVKFQGPEKYYSSVIEQKHFSKCVTLCRWH